jgi:TolA-binding protein
LFLFIAFLLFLYLNLNWLFYYTLSLSLSLSLSPCEIQLKSKDEELLQKSEHCLSLKMKVQEYELSRSNQQEESTSLRQRNQSMEKEIHRLRQILHELEPKVRSLEPMIPRLEKELEEYRQFKVTMQIECQDLKRYRQLVEDLHQDFDSIEQALTKTQAQTQQHGQGSPSRDHKSSLKRQVGRTSSGGGSGGRAGEQEKNVSTPFSPSASSSGKYYLSLSLPLAPFVTPCNLSFCFSVIVNPTLSLSQQHSLWTGLPSLRNLSPILYEKIRVMANDLYHKEIEQQDLQVTCQRLQEELHSLQEELERKREEWSNQRQQDQEELILCKDKCYHQEHELMKLREGSHILQQIKLVLLAYPGQKPFTLRYSEKEREKERERDGNSLFLDDHSMVHSPMKELKSKEDNQEDHRNADTSQVTLFSVAFCVFSSSVSFLLSLALSLSFSLYLSLSLSLSFAPSLLTKHTFQIQISDLALPDLINQTLLTNAQAVLTVRETQDQSQHLHQENEELRRTCQEVEQRNREIENQLIDLREKLSMKEQRLNDLDYEFQTHMNDAAELAEKQNALMMTLEAKVFISLSLCLPLCLHVISLSLSLSLSVPVQFRWKVCNEIDNYVLLRFKRYNKEKRV